VENEIAVNPTNPNNLIIVAQNQATSSRQLMISRSTNGGQSWSTSSLGSAQDGLSGSTPRVDPHITFDSFGNAYVTYLVAASSTQLRVIVARSSNGGTSWTAATAVSGSNLDFPFIATGPDATNTSRQTVWIGYTDTSARRVRIVAARSTGLGNLGGFTSPTTVSDNSGTFGSVAVGPAGEVAVAWQSSSGAGNGPADIFVDVDRDGLGSSFGFGADHFVDSTNVGGFDRIPAQPDRSVYSNVQLAFDRASGSDTRGRLYLLYADEDGNESNDLDIILRRSDNFGSSWSGGLVVNDDNSDNSQFLPAMAVDQTTGNLAVVWHDARNSSGNTAVQIYGTVSLDGGVSVRPNVRISSGTSSESGADGAGADDLDFGDYTAVAFHNGKFLPVWADNFNSTGNNPDGSGDSFDVYTAVVTLT
jgi:hypothetical protein